MIKVIISITVTHSLRDPPPNQKKLVIKAFEAVFLTLFGLILDNCFVSIFSL
ncbi:MAG: hypothetical protein OS130_07640 [Thermodesulfobacteriota bacterium]|nr:MAG: hypothetical protein OS130_07640 [Thermodesulfobacteriota bacterium]